MSVRYASYYCFDAPTHLQCVCMYRSIVFGSVSVNVYTNETEKYVQRIFVNPPQLVQAKFWQINDMADYIDLLRDVSYHLSHNLYALFLRETVCEYSVRCHRIPLSVIVNLLLLLHCHVKF